MADNLNLNEHVVSPNRVVDTDQLIPKINRFIAAASRRLEHGHNEVCGVNCYPMIDGQNNPCNCGHDELKAALFAFIQDVE